MLWKKQVVEDERIVARDKLLTLLRANPKVFRAMQLPSNVDDFTLMTTLLRYDSPFDILRTAGLKLPDCARAVELLPLAVEAPRKVKDLSQSASLTAKALKMTFIIGFLIVLGLVGGIVSMLFLTDKQWMQGKCSLSTFTNFTCAQENRCNFEVSVKSSKGWTSMTAYSLPVVFVPVGNGVVSNRFDADPFRCCNNNRGEVGTCCSMLDEKTLNFCDSFAGQVDWNGNKCPVGPWPCLYLEDPALGYVTALKPYTPPDVMPLALPAIAITALMAILAVVVCLVKLGVFAMCSRKMSELAEKANRRQDDDDEATEDAKPGQGSSEINPSESASAPAKKERKSILGFESKTRISQMPGLQMSSNEANPQASFPSLPGAVEVPEVVITQSPNERPPTVTKYLGWAENDNVEEGQDPDVHPDFVHGDLAFYADQAKHRLPQLTPSLIEPLHRSSSSRRKKRSADTSFASSRATDPSLWGWNSQNDPISGIHAADVRKGSMADTSTLRRSASLPVTREVSPHTRPSASHSHRRKG